MIKKLSLEKQTIASFNKDQMQAIRGGQPESCRIPNCPSDYHDRDRATQGTCNEPAEHLISHPYKCYKTDQC